MKYLQIFGYIKLPDDFEGDLADALSTYIDYKCASTIVPQDLDGESGIETVEDFSKFLDTLYHNFLATVANGGRRATSSDIVETDESGNIISKRIV